MSHRSFLSVVFSPARLGGAVLVLAAAAVVPPPAAFAVSDELDDSQFIQGLRERGMRDLLDYHLDTNPPEDPLQEQAVRIELYKIDFEDPDLSAAERTEAVDNALDAYRSLIEQAPEDHHQLPVWRTEMAEFILRVALPVRYVNAGEYVEFGLPSREARQAFDRLAVEAYEQMESAYLEAFALQGSLPRRDDFQRAFVNTGIWASLNNEFMDRRIPFSYGWAAYYASLAEEEPAGSLEEALEQLNRVDRSRLSSDAQTELDNLIGRVLVKAERYGEAQEKLEPVIDAAASQTAGQGLWARLAWVHALNGAGRADDAVETVQAIIEDFRDEDQVNPPLIILVHDAWYRVTDDYDVYEQLFEDPLVADYEEPVRAFVVQRLVAEPMTAEELESEPPLVVFAHADAMVDQAVEMRDDQPDAAAEQFREAQQVLENLIDRPDLADDEYARGHFRLGSLAYRRNRPAEAVEKWVELGRQYPDQEQAVNATVNAFQIAHNLYRQNRDTDAVVELFDAASETLLRHQPDHRIAQQHTYTRAAFLREQRRFDDAVAAYNDVPTNHPYYPDALYEVAVVFHTLWVEAEDDRRAQRARQALEAVDIALPELEEADAPDREQTLRRKHGDAILLKAELLLQQLDDPERAERTLAQFDDRFAAYDDLNRQYQRLQVNVAISLGRFDDARDRVRGFAEQGTEEGGSLIQRALDSVNRRADYLREEEGDEAEADRLNELGITLAQDLVDWAEQQSEFRDDPRGRMAFELILARQYREAGQFDESRELLETLRDRQYGTNAEGEPITGDDQLDVLYELAVTAMAQDDHEAARPLVNRILRLHPSQEGRTWWHGWVMFLQIRDARYDELVDAGEDEQAEEVSIDIFRRIARLERNDDDLGGPPWQRELEGLQLRHRP